MSEYPKVTHIGKTLTLRDGSKFEIEQDSSEWVESSSDGGFFGEKDLPKDIGLIYRVTKFVGLSEEESKEIYAKYADENRGTEPSEPTWQEMFEDLRHFGGRY